MLVDVIPNMLSYNELVERYPGRSLIICDFPIDDIEKNGIEIPGGFRWDPIINIDHHIPVKRMEHKTVTSTTLAIEQVKSGWQAKEPAVIVINHYDCDCLLSDAIMAGKLPPEERFAQASIAADHTGEPNQIADLLQSMMGLKDYQLSMRNLDLLLEGRGLDTQAYDAISKREQDRAKAERQAAQFAWIDDKIAYCEFDKSVASELYSKYLPNAVLLVLAEPRSDKPGYRNIKLRLGKASPDGFTLHNLPLKAYDVNYGGRWNAGANKRDGGTSIGLNEYALVISKMLKERLNIYA